MSVAASAAAQGIDPAEIFIRTIIEAHSPYEVLHIVDHDNCTADLVRSQYVQISRIIHPDKNKDHPNATAAFQKLSQAYDTLREAHARQLSGFDSGELAGEAALNDVLSTIYDEFSDDRYDTLLAFVDRLSAAYPELRMDPQLIMDALDETRSFFGDVKQLTANIQAQLGVIRGEYDHMRGLGYFAVRERARSLARIAMLTASLPADTKIPIPDLVDHFVKYARYKLYRPLTFAAATATRIRECGQTVLSYVPMPQFMRNTVTALWGAKQA